jgi:hypothetical protein
MTGIRNEYHLKVQTNKNLGSEAFVRGLLTQWCSALNERLRPEFFDLGEPMRRSFASEGIEAAVSAWISSGMGLLLRRRSRPKFEVSIEWFRKEESKDPRLFPWSCTVWMSKTAGDNLVLELFQFLLKSFEPAFGHATTYEDYRQKHFISFEDRNEIVEKYVGTEIGETLPGVYWVTYFGPWAVDKIGKSRFAKLKAEKVESIDAGYLVQPYSKASEAGNSLARKAETQIINQLGKEHFFNKAFVDVETLRSTPEEAALVEEKIKELKTKKK